MATQTTAAKTAAPRKRATKAAAPKAAAAAPEAAATDAVDVIVFDLVQLDDTKSYAVFTPEKSTGCVGKLYVPLGVSEVKVKLSGPASA